MFKPSAPKTAPDMFSMTENMLGDASHKKLNDPKAWHNQFFTHIKSRIDEQSFKELYDSQAGAPNAPIATMVAMMILKEAFGWSDEQLFENCRFHLLVRAALGLTNLHDTVPTASTYYLFRQRLHAHQRTHGQDLMEQAFQQLTSQQMSAFEVGGHQLRMDSKLFGSNIAWYSRYEIVHQSLISFYKQIRPDVAGQLTEAERTLFYEWVGEEPQKVVYYGTKAQLTGRLEQMGPIIFKLLQTNAHHKDQQGWQVLWRVFHEQFCFKEDGPPSDNVELRPKEQICSDSLQSPHDPDCAYRRKGDQQTKGYVANVTETIGDQPLNLITDIQLEKANVNDSRMLTPALQGSQTVSGDPPKKVHLDGGYQSPDHDAAHPDTDLVYTGIQAGTSTRYEFRPTDDGVEITDTTTGQTQLAKPAKKIKTTKQPRWYIQTNQGRTYFNEQAIRAGLLRWQLQNRPPADRQARNNVEATIYHLFHGMAASKSRYRGYYKQKMMLFCRALHVNFKRIMKFEGDDHTDKTPTIPAVSGILPSCIDWFTGIEDFYLACINKIDFGHYFVPSLK